MLCDVRGLCETSYTQYTSFVIHFSFLFLSFSLPVSLLFVWILFRHGPFDRIKLLTSTSLLVNKIGRDDRGMYQCSVTNKRSSAQAMAELKLGGKLICSSYTHTHFCSDGKFGSWVAHHIDVVDTICFSFGCVLHRFSIYFTFRKKFRPTAVVVCVLVDHTNIL